MSNEISLAAALQYADTELASIGLLLPVGLQKSVATKRYIYDKMSVPITEVVIPLGSVTSLGYYLFINRDPTNFIELRVATSGVKFARLDAVNGPAFGKFGSGITAPFAIADTGSCQMEYLIISL